MKNSNSILLVDDKAEMLDLLKRILLKRMNLSIRTALNAREAIREIRDNSIDVVVADIRMPEMDGIELLKKIKEVKNEIAVIMLTAYGSVETAVEALKIGAFDFLTKPLDNERFIHTVRKAVEFGRILREKEQLQEELRKVVPARDIIGNSDAIRRMLNQIDIIAGTEETVLIRGDTGTGKELAARRIHSLSKRSQRCFVAVNCPAIPESILESELFGYKKGAFTSASSDKEGLFESADGGTIFLDEIGDIPFSVQSKLLRVLQEKEFRPLGSTRSVHVDARVIASTNQDLEKKIANGTFRDDLYYRLNVITLRMPSLKERMDDIPLLAKFFLKRYAQEYGNDLQGFSRDALYCLTMRNWKGNVRELQNVVKRAVIFSKGPVIERANLESLLQPDPCPAGLLDSLFSLNYKEARKKAIEHFTVNYVRNLLKKSGGNVTRAAKIAGIERQSLQHVLRKYNIDPRELRDTDRDSGTSLP